LAVQFVLESIFFIFDGRIYKQNFGIYGHLWALPLSPVIIDIVMIDLEENMLDNLVFRLSYTIITLTILSAAIPNTQINNF